MPKKFVTPSGKLHYINTVDEHVDEILHLGKLEELIKVPYDPTGFGDPEHQHEQLERVDRNQARERVQELLIETLRRRQVEVGKQPEYEFKSQRKLEAEIGSLEYLLELVLPKSYVSILTAPKGNYKTTLLCYLALMIAAGKDLSDDLLMLEKGTALLLAGENVRDVKTCIAATIQYHKLDDAVKDNVLILDDNFSLDEHIEGLCAAIYKQALKPVFMGIDNATAYSPDGDTNNPGVMKKNANALIRLKKETGAHVMELAHPTKADGKDQNNKQYFEPSGGESLVNLADGLMSLHVRNKDGKRTLILRKLPKFREGYWEEIHLEIAVVTDCEEAAYPGIDPKTRKRVKKYRDVPVIAKVSQFIRQLNEVPAEEEKIVLGSNRENILNTINAHFKKQMEDGEPAELRLEDAIALCDATEFWQNAGYASPSKRRQTIKAQINQLTQQKYGSRFTLDENNMVTPPHKPS